MRPSRIALGRQIIPSDVRHAASRISNTVRTLLPLTHNKTP